MSGYHVIKETSKALKKTLFDVIDQDQRTQQFNVGPRKWTPKDISFKNPTEVAKSTDGGFLSLWLYNITENEFMRNNPPGRGTDGKPKAFPALPLNLHYLVTPNTGTGDGDLDAIGKVMQVFHDNPTVVLHNQHDDVYEQLRIRFERLTLDEQSRIWEALSEPYRLSISYLVQVARIDSDSVIDTAQVFQRYGDAVVTEPEAHAL